MARGNRTIQECQICGFEYRRSIMKVNSSGLLVCPNDYEGSYDYKSHPQNKSPSLSKERLWVQDARPESNDDRNQTWNGTQLTWNNASKYWNLI